MIVSFENIFIYNNKMTATVLNYKPTISKLVDYMLNANLDLI